MILLWLLIWRKRRWAGHVTRIEKTNVTYKIMVGMPKGNKPPVLPRCRYEDNIKVDLNRNEMRGWALY